MKVWTRAATGLLILSMLFCCLGASGNDYYQEKLAELKQQATEDHMRFLELPDGKYDATIAADMLENDEKVLEETPTGSIKVIVKDADTGEEIKDAMVLLTAELHRYSTSNGVSTQTGNAFLAINLGKTPADGQVIYDSPLFCHDDLTEDDGTQPENYLDFLSVGVASVDIATASVEVLPEDPNQYKSEDVALALSQLETGKKYAYADFIAAVKAISGLEDADEAIYQLLDDHIMDYTDDTVIEISPYSDPNIEPFQALLDKGETLTYGEFKAYVAEHQDLMVEKIVNRYYRDLAGYQPNLVTYGTPERTTEVIYKDGTTGTDTDEAYIYIELFSDAVVDKGIAYTSDGFSYRAYAFHPDYNSGVTKGRSVRQYLNSVDQELTILLSKNAPPFAVGSKESSVLGRLLDKQGKPVSGGRIECVESQATATTDEEGYFTFRFNEAGKYTFKVYYPDSAKSMKTVAVLNNEAPENELTLEIPASPKNYRLEFYEDGFDLSKLSTKSSRSWPAVFVKFILPVLLGLVLLAIMLLVLILLRRRNKRRHEAASAIGYMPPQPLPYSPQMAVPYMAPPAAAPVFNGKRCGQCNAPINPQDVFCRQCGARICPACQTANEHEARFCTNCGGQLSS